MPVRAFSVAVVVVLGLVSGSGCARERREITPTTLGTDWRKVPRGEMRPYPWPGQDVSRVAPRPSTGPWADPEAALASGTR